MSKQTVFRTSISLAADLKARMDQVAEPINWSGIAARAFERELAEIASRKQVKEMSDVVSRLRQSMGDHRDEMYKRGHDDGQAWAKDTAEFAELKRLAALREDRNWPDNYLVGSSAYIHCNAVLWAIRPEWDGESLDADQIGEVFDARCADEDEYLCGFVDGAYDIWRQVEGQLCK